MRFFLSILFALIAQPSLAIEQTAAESAGLSALMMEGSEIHPSLFTPQLGDAPLRHLPAGVVKHNPEISREAEFVNAIARSGSQGNLDAQGVHSALFALYRAKKDVGLYGLEADSEADANRREAALRKIWSHNVSIQRAQIHRQGLRLVVAWHDGVAPEVWDAVNAAVEGRLDATK